MSQWVCVCVLIMAEYWPFLSILQTLYITIAARIIFVIWFLWSFIMWLDSGCHLFLALPTHGYHCVHLHRRCCCCWRCYTSLHQSTKSQQPYYYRTIFDCVNATVWAVFTHVVVCFRVRVNHDIVILITIASLPIWWFNLQKIAVRRRFAKTCRNLLVFVLLM